MTAPSLYFLVLAVISSLTMIDGKFRPEMLLAGLGGLGFAIFLFEAMSCWGDILAGNNNFEGTNELMGGLFDDLSGAKVRTAGQKVAKRIAGDTLDPKTIDAKAAAKRISKSAKRFR